MGDVLVCLGASPSWNVLGASCSCFVEMMCQWLCRLIRLRCHRLGSAVLSVEVLQTDVRYGQKKKSGRGPFLWTFSTSVVAIELLKQEQRVSTTGPGPAGCFGRIFFSWSGILCFYFVCSRFLCVRQHSTYRLKPICAWML